MTVVSAKYNGSEVNGYYRFMVLNIIYEIKINLMYNALDKVF